MVFFPNMNIHRVPCKCDHFSRQFLHGMIPYHEDSRIMVVGDCQIHLSKYQITGMSAELQF